MMRKNGLLGNGDDALRNEVKLRKTLTSDGSAVGKDTQLATVKETPVATVKETPLAKTEATAKPKDASKPELELEPKVENPKPHVDETILKGPTVNERLAELTPGRFPREELDARLKALNEAAKEHGQIDASIRKAGSELGARKALDALENGEKITPKEMTAVQKHLQSEFEDYEKAMAKQAGKEVAADGAKEKPGFIDRMKRWAAIGAGVTVAAVTGTGLYGMLPDSWKDNVISNYFVKKNTNLKTEISLAQRQQSDAAALNCRVQEGGIYSEKAGKCLTPGVSPDAVYKNFRQGFMGMSSESDRAYLSCVAPQIEDANQTYPDDKQFQTKLREIRSACTDLTNKEFDLGEKHTFGKVDSYVTKVIQNPDYKL